MMPNLCYQKPSVQLISHVSKWHLRCFFAMQPKTFFFRNKVLEIVNIIASCVLLVITIITMVAFTRRWFNCLRKGMRW